MELHYKMVTPSARVEFEGTYSHVLVIKVLLYGLWVVLISFEEGRQDLALRRTILHFSHLEQNVNFRPQKVIRLLIMTSIICLQYNISCCP